MTGRMQRCQKKTISLLTAAVMLLSFFIPRGWPQGRWATGMVCYEINEGSGRLSPISLIPQDNWPFWHKKSTSLMLFMKVLITV